MKAALYILLAMITLSLSLSSCEELDGNMENNITTISYGTSFGECLGYCKKQISLEGTSLIFEKSGWDMDGSLPVISRTESIHEKYHSDLVEKINVEDFFQLDSIIGCPDCADGGAEWIEIKQGDSTYRVVFEYLNEPDEVKEYISYLRSFLEVFNIDSTEAVNIDERLLLDEPGRIKVKYAAWSNVQYLLEIIKEQDTSLYHINYLDEEYKNNDLQVIINGVLQYDSTMIFKGGPADEMIPDFKARNIELMEISSMSE